MTFDPAWSSRVSMACTGPLIVPFTTMWAACTSPSMRASADTTSVPGWSARAATLPRTMPSTRRPPLKITLPSMRVVAPIRLSIRFCGLLVLLNIFLPSAPSEAHAERCAGLVGTHLVHAHLDAFDLCLRAHPEGALHPPEVLESQPKGCRAGVPRLGKAHDSTLPPFRQVDHQLQRADLLGELLLGGALVGQAAVGGIRDGAKAVQLGARVLERTARRAQLLLHFAAVEAGEAPPGVVDPCRRGRRDAEGRGDAEALAKLPHSREQIA